MGKLDDGHEQRARAQLEAIEVRLAMHPQVASVVAAVHAQRLVAYVVPRPGPAPQDEALRSHLQAALPGYMIPRHFVLLDALPRAADGSVDRDALPAPQSGVPDPAMIAAVAGRQQDADPRVHYLAGVWSQLLGKAIGPQDNFFDLGGHSMLAVQMANRVKLDTGVRIQLMTLASQTLAQIASELPSTASAAPAGLGARFVGGLKGMLRGAGAAGRP